MATTVRSSRDIIELKGTDLGFSDWLEITQDRVNEFADATGDHQWIHVDTERAKSGPFGTTIAHGFMTLSLVAPMFMELMVFDGGSMAINYGLNKVRFTNPVKVGSRIRLAGTLTDVKEFDGGVEMLVDLVMQIDGEERPGFVAQGVYRFLD